MGWGQGGCVIKCGIAVSGRNGRVLPLQVSELLLGALPPPAGPPSSRLCRLGKLALR